MKNKKGFTLLELLVVVIIIGILATIALPQYRLATAKSEFSEFMQDAELLYQAQERYFLAKGQYANDIKDLDIAFPIDSCSRVSKTGSIRYTCPRYNIGMYDSFSNIQVGRPATSRPVGSYIIFIKDIYYGGSNMKKGDRICSANNKFSISLKVCESYGERIGQNDNGPLYLIRKGN